MIEKISRRGNIRLASYLAAIIIGLIIWGACASAKSAAYRKQLSLSEQRTVSSLASYMDSVETDLRKMQYVNTETMTSGLAVSLCKATSGAKTCLAELSAGDVQLYNVTKFLSQAGDYIQSLNKRITNGETLTQQDYNQIKKLHEYATSFSEKLSYMEEVMYNGDIDFENAVSTLKISDDASIAYKDEISDAEESFSDYPTLIYDGPFSDNLLTKKSNFLENKNEITAQDARKKASQYSGIEYSKLIPQEDENANIQAYVFYFEGTSIAVTKKGGYLLYLLSDRFAGEEKLNVEQAIEKGQKYLEKLGYSSMKDSYYMDNDGICTVNFAYTIDDVIRYPDLIKVSVSLENGDIVSADAAAYLINHKEQLSGEAKISASDAAENVSKTLTIERYQTAVIPTDDGNEKLTFEFLCHDNDNNDVLVYIDAETGKEAEILLLLYSDGGVLTK